jgi:hypothetical protein
VTLYATEEAACCLSSPTVTCLAAVEDGGRFWVLAGGYQGLRLWPLPFLERQKIEEEGEGGR